MIRGNTDMILLARLARRDSYGYEINKAVKRLSGGAYEFSEATLYTAFRRLEQEGQIESYWGGEERGARRRYYRITPAGRAALSGAVAAWTSARETIDRLIGTEETEA
jgi:DNA-binding PadR family transcriptional regulator